MTHLRHTPLGAQCWACTITTERPIRYQNSYKQVGRWSLYELVVEHLESKPRGTILRVSEIVQEVGPSPELFGIVKLVFVDLTLHGLMRCVRRDKSGRMCLGHEMIWD
jgi:hypothetical protein